MKQLALSVCLLVFGISIAGAQNNLVPNFSFEDTLTCPYAPGQLWITSGWEKVGGGGSIIYCNSCSSETCCSVPANSAGYEYARTGQAYVLLGLLYNNHTFPGFIEGNFIGIELSETLTSGKTYEVEFFLSLMDSARFACKNLGVHFSLSQPINDIDTILSLVPQIDYDGDFLTEKVGWTKIEGSFVADGGEQYMTIGNFDGAQFSDTLNLNHGGTDPTIEYWEVAYYFLDDVSVVEDTSIQVASTWLSGPSFSLYPNPANEQLMVEVSSHQQGVMVMFDASGRAVLSQQITSDRLHLDVSLLGSGIYTVSLQSEEGVLRKKIVIQR